MNIDINNSLVKILTKKKWKIIFSITSVIGLLWLIGTATFLFNINDTRFVARGDGFGTSHNCLTGYTVAAHLAIKKADNIYAHSNYTFSSSTLTPIHKSVDGIFMIDKYYYPPPFLILPYGLLTIFKEFFQFRIAWFVLTTTLFIGTIIYVSIWCGAFRTESGLLIFPILLCAPTVHIAFQIGNVHLLIIAISILAMIAFDKDHPIVGGLLLSFAIISKIWPMILLVHLLIQRRWNSVVYCSIAVIAYTLVGILLFGLEPYLDFFTYQLPRLSNGEAFNFMIWNPKTVIENMSIFGISHKLYALNLLSSRPALNSPVLSWSVTTLIGLIAIAVSLRRLNKNGNNHLMKVQLWLAFLTLVQLRSPFLPWQYGVVSTLWLLILIMTSVRGWKFGITFFAWLCLSINIPVIFLFKSDSLNLYYTLLTSLFIYGAIIVSIRKYWRHSYLVIPIFNRPKA